MDLRRKIGNKIKEARGLAKMTQKDVSNQLGYDTAQFISNVERGEASLPLEKLRDIIKLLRIADDEIIKMLLDDYVKRLTEVFPEINESYCIDKCVLKKRT